MIQSVVFGSSLLLALTAASALAQTPRFQPSAPLPAGTQAYRPGTPPGVQASTPGTQTYAPGAPATFRPSAPLPASLATAGRRRGDGFVAGAAGKPAQTICVKQTVTSTPRG